MLAPAPRMRTVCRLITTSRVSSSRPTELILAAVKPPEEGRDPDERDAATKLGAFSLASRDKPDEMLAVVLQEVVPRVCQARF